MQIIEELEPQRRGVYCGAIGYIGFDGSMDTNIAIRTLVQQGDRVYTWAGGGIVADSKSTPSIRRLSTRRRRCSPSWVRERGS